MAEIPSRDEPVRPLTWCTVHFAGAVEAMAGCLVWRARIEVANEMSDPDCVLVQRLLVDREAIEKRIRSAMTREVDEWADAVVDAALGEA